MWDLSTFRVSLERQWVVIGGEVCCRWSSVEAANLAFLTRTALADSRKSEPRLEPVAGETVGLRPGLLMVGDA
jgi:hypothetical protein